MFPERIVMQFARLAQLAAGYFNEDFPYEAPTTDGVVHKYLEETSPATAGELRIEVAELLTSGRDEQQLADLWHGLGSAYAPSGDGLTYRQWFEHLAELLRQQLDA